MRDIGLSVCCRHQVDLSRYSTERVALFFFLMTRTSSRVRNAAACQAFAFFFSLEALSHNYAAA